MSIDKIKISNELHARERIYMVIRKHWVVPAVKGLFWMVLWVLFYSAGNFLKANFTFFSDPLVLAVLNLVQTSVVMVVVLGLFITWIIYYLNVQVITNERIIDINQKSLLHHQSSELNLDRLQDVTTEIKGPIENFFNYGNVYVQTAGETQNFVFDHVPNPHRIAKITLKLYELSRGSQNFHHSKN